MSSLFARICLAGLALAPSLGEAAGPAPVKLDLKAGQELTIPASIVDGKVVLGPARLGKLGAARPAEGEIVVGLTPGDKQTFYSQLLVTERLPAPVDFVATGLIGEIKIDERVVCGKIDAPISQHIGSTAWRVALSGFEVGKGTGTCE
jgi:hypothetical protein